MTVRSADDSINQVKYDRRKTFRRPCIRDQAARTIVLAPVESEVQLIGVQLSRALGLKRTAVSIARMPPGKESFVYHSHHHEEEWLYILSGRGIAEINGEELEVGPGDFIAFPTPSVPHHLKNPFDQEIVYLMGVKTGSLTSQIFLVWANGWSRAERKFEVYDLSNAKPFGPLDT
jgi:uncharacterized cupin superfamily protein